MLGALVVSQMTWIRRCVQGLCFERGTVFHCHIVRAQSQSTHIHKLYTCVYMYMYIYMSYIYIYFYVYVRL